MSTLPSSTNAASPFRVWTTASGVALSPARKGLAIAALIYIAATTYLTWPLPRFATSHIPDPYGVGFAADTLLVMWILRWMPHALVTNPLRLLDGNAFHPQRMILLHSEHLLGDLPLFAPTAIATGNPVLALNVLTLASFVLAGLSMHVLVRRWTSSEAAAYVGGLAFAFAPWRFPAIGGPFLLPPSGALHLLQVQYLPLTLIALEAATIRAGWRTIVAAAGVLVMQSLCSYYLAYIAFVVAGCWLVAVLLTGGRRKELYGPTAAIGVAMAVLVLASWPYVIARAAGIFVGPRSTHVLALLNKPLAIVSVYPGWGASALALICAALYLPALLRGSRPRRFVAFLLLAVLGFVLARTQEGLLGDGLRAVVPGFERLRVSARFAIVMTLGVSGLAALAVAEGVRRTKPIAMRAVIVSCAVGFVLWPACAGPPLRLRPLPTSENSVPVYRWLAKNGGGEPLLELPIGRGVHEMMNGAMAMYASTFHWLPILNGHTGYYPRTYVALRGYALQLPARAALDVLIACADLRWILRHTNGTESRAEAVAWRKAEGLEKVGAFRSVDGAGIDWLYRVTLPQSAPCPLPEFASVGSERPAPQPVPDASPVPD